MLYQLKRTREEITKDTPCIGVCTLNEQNVCIGCDRHIDEIIQAGNPDEKEYTLNDPIWDKRWTNE